MAFVENLEDVTFTRLDAGASWPVSGISKVSSFEISKELQGDMLPGQTGSGYGLSIESARVDLPQESVKMAPWVIGSGKVDTGGSATLTYGSSPANPLGTWWVDSVNGSILSNSVSANLLGRQFPSKRVLNTIPDYAEGQVASSFDTVWGIDWLARQAGFYATPPVNDRTLISSTFVGSTVSEIGESSTVVGGTFADATPDLPVRLSKLDSSMTLRIEGGAVFPLLSSNHWFLTLSVSGLRTIGLEHSSAVTGTSAIEIDAPNRRVRLRIQNDGSTWSPWASYPDPGGTLHRIQLRFSFFFNQYRLDVRSSPTGSWTSTIYTSISGYGFNGFILGTETAELSGLIFDTVAGISPGDSVSPTTFAAPTARLEKTGLVSPTFWVDGKKNVWESLQASASESAGIVWVEFDGTLRNANRESLSGLGSLEVLSLDLDSRVEDLPWVTDSADFADRLEVTYFPPDYSYPRFGAAGAEAILAWSAQEALELAPSQTLTILIEFEGSLDPWYGFDRKTIADPLWTSTWDARYTRDGTGANPPDTALTVTLTVEAIGRGTLTVTNNTGSTLYTVDGEGVAWLQIRSSRIIAQTTPAVLVFGQSDPAKAVAPLQVSLGRNIHTLAQASDLGGYLWSLVSARRWRAEAVRTVLDWSLDIGQIRTLSHPDSGLSVTALVSKVSFTGGPGNITQRASFVLLTTSTWAAFDTVWTGETWSNFDTMWAGETWDNFDDDPLREV